MRKVTISKKQFDTFLFPQIAQSNAKTDSERETAIRVIKILKDRGLTMDKPLTKREERLREDGENVFEFKELVEDEATFVLEEDEHNFIKKRLEENAKGVALLVLEDFEALRDLFKNAEKFTPEAPEDETADEAPADEKVTAKE